MDKIEFVPKQVLWKLVSDPEIIQLKGVNGTRAYVGELSLMAV